MPTRPAGSAKLVRLAALLALVGGALWFALSFSGSSAGDSESGGDWAGLAGSARSEISVGERVLVVLNAPSLASRVAASGRLASDEEERVWEAEAASRQRAIIARLAVSGAAIEPEYSYTRVMNGFSAALDAGARSILERSPDVFGVYPVRVTYPAAFDVGSLGNPPALLRGYMPQVALPPYDGRGVTVALLDTGVDRYHEHLRGHVLEGKDIVGGNPEVIAAPNPDDRSQLERHGTQMAGIVIGPAALGGVAPGASIYPVRVAGWQRDSSGAYEVFGRTDQLIAGLERSVDPNGDGDAHDAARIALVGVSAPLAGFADGPEARAVRGAAALDTLVVAPAGNDGVTRANIGTIGAPGGARDALTVGALDLRQRSERVRVVIRSGLEVLYDEATALGGSFAPEDPLTRSLARPRRLASETGGLKPAPSPESFFSNSGYSLVAGKAALLDAGDDPREAARNASLAGARAVILYGRGLPSGALGLDENVKVPVLSVPAAIGRAASARIDRGDDVEVSIGRPFVVKNEEEGEIAPFSSHGLTFAGAVKPDVVAPGAGVATSDAGATSDGYPAFATVSGSSASAAIVAGAAALLAQARPELGEQELRSLLVSSAKPVEATVSAQGAGAIDLEAAAQSPLAVSPQSLDFPTPRGRSTKVKVDLRLRNLSKGRLIVAAGAEVTEGSQQVAVEAEPRQDVVEPGVSRKLRITLHLLGKPREAHAEGRIELLLSNGTVLRVPWAFRMPPARPASLVARAALSRRSFSPSDGEPVMLTLGLGRVSEGSEGRIEPAARVDIELWNEDGRYLGILARLRDVLPGHYVFGLTGRSPAGALLTPGGYRLRIVTQRSGGGERSFRSLDFRVGESPSHKR